MVSTSVVDPTGPTTTDCLCCRTVPLLSGGGEVGMIVVIIVIMISVRWTLFVVLIPGLGAPLLSVDSDTTLGGAGDVTVREAGICALRTCRERLTHGRDQPFNTFGQHFGSWCVGSFGASLLGVPSPLSNEVSPRGVSVSPCVELVIADRVYSGPEGVGA